MAVWVQHKQNTSWEPAIIASQTSPNSYWIMQENGDEQPKLYRRTRSMLKIRCTEVQKPSLEYSQPTETHKAKFHSPYSFLMKKETMSGTILSIKYQAILSSRQNRILPLCLILYFQKERRKMQILQKKHLQKHMHLHLHPHWRQSRNDHTLQDQESQHARTLGDQPVHIVTFTCETSFRPG